MSVAHRVLTPGSSANIGRGCCALAIMTKAPRAGRVKTRLTPPLTPAEAADLNVCFLQDLADSISAVTKSAAARGIGVYTPVGAEETYRGILPDDFFLLPQRGETFGDRLMRALQDLFQLGFESACLINSDSPTVSSTVFSEAVEFLARPGEDVVLGPSEDGGYYLIGMKQLHAQLFSEIDWSTDRVFQQTLDRAGEIELGVHLLPDGFDVDDGRTLRRLCGEVFNGGQSTARFTSAYLAQILEREGRTRIWPND